MSGRGLDAFNALVAAIQTGFGPFMAAYLGAQGWTQTQIGAALSISTVAVLITQFPAGMVVDAVRDARWVARWTVLCLALALALLTFWPLQGPVFAAMALQGAASSVIGPSIAAISLALVGRAALGERLGRNARFASIGNGITAAAIGLIGAALADATVLALIAALAVPAWLALWRIGDLPNHRPPPSPDAPTGWREIAGLMRNPRLTIFAFCIGGFHLASAAMLPMAAARLSREGVARADLILAIAVIVPSVVTALASPAIGRYAQAHGRRGIMLLGWALVPAEGVMLAALPLPWLLPVAQVLGGAAGAVFAVMLPLVAADLSQGTRHFTLCLSSLSFPVALGATLSTTLAGLAADRLGDAAGFTGLALAGLAGTALLALAMPETRAPSGRG